MIAKQGDINNIIAFIPSPDAVHQPSQRKMINSGVYIMNGKF